MSIFIPKKRAKYYYFNEKGEKILMSVSAFLGKFDFLTNFTLKFYQKSNSSPKNNIFSRKYFRKNSKNSSFWIKLFSKCFITLRIFFKKKMSFFFNFTSSKLMKSSGICKKQKVILKLQNVMNFLT